MTRVCRYPVYQENTHTVSVMVHSILVFLSPFERSTFVQGRQGTYKSRVSTVMHPHLVFVCFVYLPVMMGRIPVKGLGHRKRSPLFDGHSQAGRMSMCSPKRTYTMVGSVRLPTTWYKRLENTVRSNVEIQVQERLILYTQTDAWWA